jgi:TonB family protein
MSAAALLFAAMTASAAPGETRKADSGNHVEIPAPPPAPPGQPVPPQPPRDPEDLSRSICVKPALKPLIETYHALSKDGRPQRVVLWVRYVDDGSLTDVRIERASDIEALDAAVLTWARRVRLCPGFGPGEGKIPIEFKSF